MADRSREAVFLPPLLTLLFSSCCVLALELPSSASPTPTTSAPASLPPTDANATTPATPTPDTTTSASNGGGTSTSLSVGATVGISIGGVLVIALLAYVLVRRWRRRALASGGAASSFIISTSKKSNSAGTGGSSSSTNASELNWKALETCKVALEDIALTKVLAAGAFGEVWLGEFRGDVVAVKTCLANKSSRKNLQHFIDELSLMATLESPHIVRLVAAAWTRPTDLKAVLEYMNMGDLRDFLADTTPATFSWKNKLDCGLSIAKALVYLKEKQVIHRDLKSRNVLLDSERGTKLADFGISREDSENTMTAGVGTYRWMAPEVLTFKYYTIAVDVFSFGVLLSELDTHQIPYTDVRNDQGHPISDTAIVGMVLYNGLRPKFSGACLPWVENLALRCMATDPDERPEPTEIVRVIATELERGAGFLI
ncbi:Aste57867_18923 [Aphanomyces stellatus]|uniref:Aste57867_18923 protein n=1 Tax=Aphanomyces stellatus TaxID=120398 RepID=A0A485LCT6_9STRA|nr:hypothetical protein As57867_018859 [Aphanomyces stellatus]VFT95655.1 Aste57867_18923 [Aphanomyces stellatus]